MARKAGKKTNILETVETFIAAVPWGENRKVLVFQRTHGGRTYVRLRTWQRHTKRGWWYPSQRFFVIPVGNANTLAKAITAAARGEVLTKKPDWLIAREYAEEEMYDRSLEREDREDH